MKIKGIIFDMDGVIIDTEKWYQRFWVQGAVENGFPMKPEHVLKIRSLPEKLAAPLLKKIVCPDFDYAKVRDRRKELMAHHIEEYGIEKKKGIDQLLQYIKSNGLKCAVATATDIDRTTQYLKQIGIYDYFDKIICASMVKNGKPEPDVYLEASRQLGLQPMECVAVEDSPNGVLSAFRARCNTIMVPDLTPPDQNTAKLLFAKADDLIQVIDILEIHKKAVEK